MNTEQSREETLFDAVRRLTNLNERAAFLDIACEGDLELRQRVEELLAAQTHADAFFERSPQGETVAAGDLTVLVSEAPPLMPRETVGDKIGRYKLLQKIGEGGCGVVYMAEQEEPMRRRVALKIIKLGMDTRSVIARFKAEEQALAMMDHPNIAKVLDAGATETGRPYFVMELVRGIRITEYCDQTKLPTRDRLNLVIKICHAIQHAHQKGIIHRDIKPSNILVTLHDGVPVPKVIDFGIAKATEGRLIDQTLFTAFEQFLGTPAYMSPEQAEMSGLDIDTRSDIYSLGVLLYELLTGRTPFDAGELLKAGMNEMRRIIREQEPPRPSTRLRTMLEGDLITRAEQRQIEAPALIHLLQGDLDWIVMRCLEKDRTRRYETTNGLAMDIERHLSNEPVIARPPSAAYRFKKFVRRNKFVFTAGTAVAAAMIAGLTFSIWQAVRAMKAEREQRSLREEALSAQNRAVQSEADALSQLYAANMNLAQQAWQANNVGRLRQLLGETESYPARGFEWYFWQQQTHLERRTLRGHLGRVDAVAFFPDGRKMVSAGEDRTIRVWDAATARQILSINGHVGLIFSVAVSPGGKRIATASWDYTAKVWDAATGSNLVTLSGHKGAVWSVAFSPDGQWIATASADHKVKVWVAATGRELFSLAGHRDSVNSVSFSPDGRRLATASGDKTAMIWDLESRTELFTLKGHSAVVMRAVFSPKGVHIVTIGMDRSPKVWDALSGQELFELTGHAHRVLAAAFSSDGRRIVTGSDDQTVRVWETSSGRELLTLKGHTGYVRSVAFSSDGQSLLSGSHDGTVKLWHLPTSHERLLLSAHTSPVNSAAFSANGEWIITGSKDRTANVWETASGQQRSSFKGPRDRLSPFTFSADGQRIFALSDDQKVWSWDVASGTPIPASQVGQVSASAAAFSPDGRSVVTFGWDHVGTVRDIVTGTAKANLKGHSGRIWSVAFSPDGKRIATGSEDRTAKVWNPFSDQVHLRLDGHIGPIRAVAFSRDGKRIVTASVDSTARIWDSSTGSELLRLEGHTGPVWSVDFSPDGDRIVTGSGDHTAKVWDSNSGRVLLTLEGHTAGTLIVVFSPDGRRILTGSEDHTARLWEAASAEDMLAWAEIEQTAEERLLALRQKRQEEENTQRAARARDPGAIKDWLVLAPIPLNGDQTMAEALADKQLADEGQLRPIAGDRVEVGDRQLVWRPAHLDDYILDFSALLGEGPDRSSQLAYAVCYVHSDRERSGLQMRIGHDDQAMLHLNGVELYQTPFPSPWVPEVTTIEGVQLRAGVNTLELKVLNSIGHWLSCIRLTDAAGNPVEGIRVMLDPEDEHSP